MTKLTQPVNSFSWILFLSLIFIFKIGILIYGAKCLVYDTRKNKAIEKSVLRPEIFESAQNKLSHVMKDFEFGQNQER